MAGIAQGEGGQTHARNGVGWRGPQRGDRKRFASGGFDTDIVGVDRETAGSQRGREFRPRPRGQRRRCLAILSRGVTGARAGVAVGADGVTPALCHVRRHTGEPLLVQRHREASLALAEDGEDVDCYRQIERGRGFVGHRLRRGSIGRRWPGVREFTSLQGDERLRHRIEHGTLDGSRSHEPPVGDHALRVVGAQSRKFSLGGKPLAHHRLGLRMQLLEAGEGIPPAIGQEAKDGVGVVAVEQHNRAGTGDIADEQ
ncbi:hypothetical protein J2X57_001343 [Luteibacter sp. 1214]|uniref:hypothetical protein n=1 Tax=Luteibacter sp. 1214 TaxID=2817735 RepID=UPI00285D1064|nr:hypothetical protein [Luteibacter sp. 1214]MDR6642136.1 hypothetical protein [Luteibacter sp. 1214]